MGIAATADGCNGARAECASGGAPACGHVATDPKPSPDLAVALALPGRCLQVYRHQQRLVRDLRSPTGRLLGVLAGKTRSGPCPRRRRPAAGRRPDPCRARWRHSSPRAAPKGRRSSWPPAVPPAWSYPLHGAIQFRLHVALLDRGVDNSRSLSHATAQAGRSLRPTGATEVARDSSRRTEIAGHSSAGKAWPGENVIARIYHRPINWSCSIRLSQFCVQGNRVRLRQT